MILSLLFADLFNSGLAQPTYAPYTFATLTGDLNAITGNPSASNSVYGAGANASFGAAVGAAVDQNGNLFVADMNGGVIRKVTPRGVVTTVAGNGQPGAVDGAAGTAEFYGPCGVAVDQEGDIFVADTGNSTIRKISPSGTVSTIAGTARTVGILDGSGSAARFDGPAGVAVDGNGNVYVADTLNETIRKITPSGIVSTLAGIAGMEGHVDGPGATAQFVHPTGIAVDADANIYVTEVDQYTGSYISGNNDIRKIAPDGTVTTLAGAPYVVFEGDATPLPEPTHFADGQGAAAQFDNPSGIAVDGQGNLFVSDTGNSTVRRITPTGLVSTLAGNPLIQGHQDGIGPGALFSGPTGIAVNATGQLLVVDGGSLIRIGAAGNIAPALAEPVVISQLLSPTVAVGSTVALTVSSADQPDLTYQWYGGGQPIYGAVGPTFVLPFIKASSQGYFYCVVSNAFGTVTSNTATITAVDTIDPGRLINLSARTAVGTGANILIGGFVIGGNNTSGSEAVLIRASGPALAEFQVPGFLSDPSITLAGGDIAVTNDGWGGNAGVAATAAAVGAFDWTDPTSHDAALVELLPAQPATALVAGQSGDSGIALLEIYDATPEGTYAATSPRLINVSVRATVGTSANVLIVGFVVGGTTWKTVLIRASGPALAASPFGLSGVLPDPSLELDSSQSSGFQVLASNTGWGGDPQVAAVANSVGAFSWGAGSTPDSALVATLPPGAYTVQVSGASGDTGIALVEVYDVP